MRRRNVADGTGKYSCTAPERSITLVDGRGSLLKLAVITNPKAAGARTGPGADAIRSALAPLGIDVSIHSTSSRGHATRLAAALSPDIDVLCVMGGDGTIHEVVNGMMPHPVPMVVIPSGAGNDLSSLIAFPKTPSELAAVLEDGFGTAIDLIDFGDRFCVNSAGLGFEGLVNRYSQAVTRVRGHLRYMIALCKALRSYACPYFKIITSDGTEITGERLLVSVGNGHRTGGTFYLTPDAYPDDGLIDVCIVNSMGRVKMIRLLPKSFSGRHTASSDVRMLRTESLSIESDVPYPMHVDGEYFDGSPGRREIEIRHGALPIICKKSSINKLKSTIKRIL
jgi:YegS/Rv2252/BmrU family lipid kinase